MEWARWYETFDRRVAEDFIEEPSGGTEIFVSTIFLGLDFTFGFDGPPQLFETMAFGAPEQAEFFGRKKIMRPPLHQYSRRYATWDEAVAGHEQVCAEVREHISRDY